MKNLTNRVFCLFSTLFLCIGFAWGDQQHGVFIIHMNQGQGYIPASNILMKQAAPLEIRWSLVKEGADKATISVSVDGKNTTTSSFSYDPNTNTFSVIGYYKADSAITNGEDRVKYKIQLLSPIGKVSYEFEKVFILSGKTSEECLKSMSGTANAIVVLNTPALPEAKNLTPSIPTKDSEKDNKCVAS